MDDKCNCAGEKTTKRKQCSAESTLSQAAIFAFNAYSLASTCMTEQWNFSKHFHPLPRGPSNDECTSPTQTCSYEKKKKMLDIPHFLEPSQGMPGLACTKDLGGVIHAHLHTSLTIRVTAAFLWLSFQPVN